MRVGVRFVSILTTANALNEDRLSERSGIAEDNLAGEVQRGGGAGGDVLLAVATSGTPLRGYRLNGNQDQAGNREKAFHGRPGNER